MSGQGDDGWGGAPRTDPPDGPSGGAIEGDAPGPSVWSPPGVATPSPGFTQPVAQSTGATQPAAAPPGWYPTPDGTTAWWDGVQWHLATQQPASKAHGGRYKPVATLGAVVQACLATMAVAELFAGWAQLRRRQVVDQFFDGPLPPNADDLAAADDLVALASSAYLVGFLVTAVLVLVWCHRIFSNLRGPFATPRLDFTPGWAVGWWFVPFANLVKPKQMMNQAWQASGPEHPYASNAWSMRKAPAILSWWWAALLLSSVVVRISVVSEPDPNGLFDRNDFDTATNVALTSAALGMVAAVLAVVVFRVVTTRHTQRAIQLGLAAP